MLLEPQRTRYDLSWRMFGIPTRVHPFFWLATLATGWAGKETHLGPWAVWVACVFVSILLHEFGHALTARHFGASGLRVWLYWLGGLAISDGGLTRRQRIIELLMGPGAGFLLWGILFGFSFFYNYDDLARYDGALFFYLWLAVQYLLFLNLIWGLVNLLPVYPLDGGQIARELFLARRPRDGVLLSLRLSLFTALLIALFTLGVMLVNRVDPRLLAWLPIQPSEFTLLMFAGLALLSYQLSRPENLHAAQEHSFQEYRQPWEQDADWWKK